jgi:hypothetical protein
LKKEILLDFCKISFDFKDFENFELLNINYCKNFKNLMLRFNMNISDINDMENVHMLCDYDVRRTEIGSSCTNLWPVFAFYPSFLATNVLS